MSFNFIWRSVYGLFKSNDFNEFNGSRTMTGTFAIKLTNLRYIYICPERYLSWLLLLVVTFLQREYVVVSPEIEASVSRCVVSQGPYQCTNSSTPYTD